jgi:hypothetical protein
VAAVLLAALLAWNFWPRPVPEVGKAAVLPPPKEAKGEPKVPVHPKVVYVYRDALKKKLDLPAPVVADEAKKVIATGKLAAEERPYTLSAVIDTATGESEVYARPDPLPWIGPGKRGAVGIAYGLHNGQPGGKVYAYRDLLQVKALHLGARADLYQSGDNFVGGYVEYRF